MNIVRKMVLLGLAVAAAVPLGAQTDTAAERARLANERIRQEAERRAEAERERQAEAAARSEATAPAADLQGDKPPQSGNASRPPTPAAAASGDDISRALEQLRELGELRDAGYVTDEEFERIKTRILDTRF